MRHFTVSIGQRDFSALVLPPELQLTYVRGSAAALGGMQEATIVATGPRTALYAALDWLRCPVAVYNRKGTPVWWGYVAALTGQFGALQIGLSLDEIANRVQVIYAYQDPTGKSVKGTTAWVEDAVSRATYGTWELIKSLGNANADQAIYDRDLTLATLKQPVGTPAIVGQSGPDSVTLLCRGWFSTLTASYYARPDGKVQSSNNRGNAISLGQKLTANTIGFEPNNDYIHDIQGRLHYFESDQWVQVSGSASNNGAFRVARGTTQLAASWASTSIWFNTSDDILTTASNFAFVDANDLILVSGATYPSNNGYFWVDTVQDGNHIVTVAKTITSYGTGPLVTVQRGNAVGCEANFVRESPGATVTLTTIGEKLAQSFVVTGASAWKAYEVQLRVMKVNTPADGVIVELCADNAGLPGTVLDSATVSAANFGTSLTWMTFVLTGAATLTIGATYWLVIRRSGASEYANYYQVDVDEDQSYAAGAAKAWNGASWITPPTPVDIPFAVFGKEETTTQLAAIASSAGQFMAGSQIMDTSGLLTYQYREGRLRAYDEALALLAAGTSDGRRLLAEVTPQRYLSIYKEPLQGSVDTYVLGMDGTWTDNLGSPLEEGVLPVGKWVEIRALPAEVLATTKVTPFVVDEAEYDADSGELRITPRGAWTTATGVRQG